MDKTNPFKNDIVVAGQICLDIILMFADNITDLASAVVPGKCVVAENATISTGGSVANTGLALHQLGIPTRLIAKIGADAFGKSIRQLLEQKGEGLTDIMIEKEGEITAYSIVLIPKNTDRSFLYVPGANNTFQSDDIADDHLQGARIFHFGYPPEMKLIYAKQGKEFIRLMRRVKNKGVTTSLDMAFPDVNGEPGKINWFSWLQGSLPFIDVFLPSFDEIFFMLEPQKYQEKSPIDADLLRNLANQVLEMGVAMVLIKLGEHGIYFQSTDDHSRLDKMGAGKPSNPAKWLNQTIWVPSFQVDVIGTTGAGDCAVAGFLAGLFKGLDPDEALTMASAVGAYSTECADAASGVPHWDKVKNRVDQGWATLHEHRIGSHL